MIRKILLMEDNLDIAEAVARYFEVKSGGDFEVDTVSEGNLSLLSHPVEDYSLIILDIMLPGMDGYSVCTALRKKTAAPVLFLTALAEEEEIIRGYEVGGDDYVVKPFHLSELYMKSRAWISRSSGITADKKLQAEGLVLNLKERVCLIEGEKIYLTFIEFEILEYLMENPAAIISRENFLSAIWPEKLDINDRTVDSHIKSLRKKLGKYGRYIKTVRGSGYIFKAQ